MLAANLIYEVLSILAWHRSRGEPRDPDDRADGGPDVVPSPEDTAPGTRADGHPAA
mgnify:FL=1